MGREAKLQRIFGSGVIAVMRGTTAETVLHIARAVRAGGVEVLEVTVDSPGALHLLEAVTRELGDEALVGAGTVLDAETARAALLAGAQFLFTPTANPAVAEMGNRYGIPVILGALTPTEIVAAYSAGAAAVKVFPAVVLGPEYLRQVRAPLPHIPLIPTGGIDLENVRAFIAAGAAAVGVGSSLLDRRLIQAGDWRGLAERARQFTEAVAAARAGGR